MVQLNRADNSYHRDSRFCKLVQIALLDLLPAKIKDYRLSEA
jgi:hypothetical protein